MGAKKAVNLFQDLLLSLAAPLGGGYSVLKIERGRQHSLLSPLDCLSAKASEAVNGGA